MALKVCNYGNCLNEVGEDGLTVSLKRETVDGEKRAVFCCAAHAAASLRRLAADRGEEQCSMPRAWRTT